jgi:hypothetical protein
MTKTTNFNHLREQARASDPGWDAAVAERRNAMLDALAVGEPKPCPNSANLTPPSPELPPRNLNKHGQHERRGANHNPRVGGSSPSSGIAIGDCRAQAYWQ